MSQVKLNIELFVLDLESLSSLKMRSSSLVLLLSASQMGLHSSWDHVTWISNQDLKYNNAMHIKLTEKATTQNDVLVAGLVIS